MDLALAAAPLHHTETHGIVNRKNQGAEKTECRLSRGRGPSRPTVWKKSGKAVSVCVSAQHRISTLRSGLVVTARAIWVE